MYVSLRKREEDFQGSNVYSISVVNGNEFPEGSRLECLVYVPEQIIDGHQLIRRTHRECARDIEDIHDVVIGVTSHPERRNNKVMECARQEAKEIANYCECEVKEE